MWHLIDGLSCLDYKDEGELFFFNDELKNKGIFIEVSTQVFSEGENVKVETYIAVKQVKENDAKIYTIYWGDLLANIQIYRIIKDVFEIVNNWQLEPLEELLHEMSSQYQSASMQSDENHRKEMLETGKREFEEVYGDE